jgi:hypothetical protein
MFVFVLCLAVVSNILNELKELATQIDADQWKYQTETQSNI